MPEVVAIFLAFVRVSKFFFHRQFCEISEREEFWNAMIAEAVFAAPTDKNQFLYKRRKIKDMCISSIDSPAELWN